MESIVDESGIAVCQGMGAMETGFLLNGIAVGFAIAAPVGPIGTLCIRRSLEGGFFAGLAIGLGAALADALAWIADDKGMLPNEFANKDAEFLRLYSIV